MPVIANQLITLQANSSHTISRLTNSFFLLCAEWLWETQQGSSTMGRTLSFIDVDYTDELTAITAHFYGFFSQSCGGISNYEWAVGGDSSRESVLPFTDSGVVVVGTNGSGYAQVSVITR